MLTNKKRERRAYEMRYDHGEERSKGKGRGRGRGGKNHDEY